MNSSLPQPRPGAREQIKRAARNLFAERGIDGVTVREIVEASGQKNHGSLSYYFGTKEALVRELVADGAGLINRRRHAMLDQLEGSQAGFGIREVVEVLVYPSIHLTDEQGEEDHGYVRFITLLSMSHRRLFMEALEEGLNSGYLRCLEHLRRLMPEIPAAERNQRFIFINVYLNGVISAREAALAEHTRAQRSWASEYTTRHFIHTLTAILEAPPSL
ncbi:TetR family transcriptional regulator [Alcanivorax sp. N3-2A]|nr:TetR family transcriptional regulator [Alcanivorax sp. N3-2A]|tara:strand:- start:50524 stop:51177 length:654 start_codon:yes stop_codon:yes gene_type:complete